MMRLRFVQCVRACQDKLTLFLPVVNRRSDRVPQHWGILPLVNQSWRSTFKQQRWLCRSSGKILVSHIRILQFNYAFGHLLSRSGLAAPFGAFYQYRSKSFKSLFEHYIGRPF
jgi:hypothetical protein